MSTPYPGVPPRSDRLTAAVEELVAALREEVARTTPTADGPPRLLSVDEAADVLGVGRTLVYREMSAGRLRSVKVGRRRLIPADALDDYGSDR